MNQIVTIVFEKTSNNTYNFWSILTLLDPISRKQKFTWTWKLAHICRLIISTFTRRMNQIVRLVFDKILTKPIFLCFDPFWPHISRGVLTKIFSYLYPYNSGFWIKGGQRLKRYRMKRKERQKQKMIMFQKNLEGKEMFF